MRYTPLGRTGLFVSELCLGTMTFGGTGMWKAIGEQKQDEADEMVKTALDAGINFIDTANVYSNGQSEQLLGQALLNNEVARDDVVIATKVLGPMGEGINDRGWSRKHVMSQIEQSLERLQLDHVDLYQIHGWDPVTPIDELMRTFDDIVSSGMAHHIGVSNWAAWQIMKAQGIADCEGLTRFETLQAYYTLAARDLERDIAPMLKDQKMGLMVWSPLAGGLLSGKYDREGDGEGRRADFDFPPVNKDRAFDCVDAMRPMAEKRDVSVAQIALAWLLHREVVMSVIVGASKIAQLKDNIAACDVVFTEEELDTLDEVSKLPEEYPGWMLDRQGEYRSAANKGDERIKR